MRLSRAVTVGVALLLSTSASFAEHGRDGGDGIGPIIFSVPQANKREGTPPSISALGLKLKLLVSKEFPLENPSGVITSFGELSTGVGTEPDQNTYVVSITIQVERISTSTMAVTFFFRGTKMAPTWPT